MEPDTERLGAFIGQRPDIDILLEAALFHHFHGYAAEVVYRIGQVNAQHTAAQYEPFVMLFEGENATLPFVLAIADKGFHKALQKDSALKRGVNTYKGLLTNNEVAQAQKREFEDIDNLLLN